MSHDNINTNPRMAQPLPSPVSLDMAAGQPCVDFSPRGEPKRNAATGFVRFLLKATSDYQ